jgi:putative solute:sodium symporter small subunit
MIDDEQRRLHGKRSFKLVAGTAVAVFVIALVIPLLAPAFNGTSFLRFPLGLFILSHGTVLAIISLIYWASARQDGLDRRHGLTSEF